MWIVAPYVLRLFVQQWIEVRCGAAVIGRQAQVHVDHTSAPCVYEGRLDQVGSKNRHGFDTTVLQCRQRLLRVQTARLQVTRGTGFVCLEELGTRAEVTPLLARPLGEVRFDNPPLAVCQFLQTDIGLDITGLLIGDGHNVGRLTKTPAKYRCRMSVLVKTPMRIDFG